jgi:hypothetical protein
MQVQLPEPGPRSRTQVASEIRGRLTRWASALGEGSRQLEAEWAVAPSRWKRRIALAPKWVRTLVFPVLFAFGFSPTIGHPPTDDPPETIVEVRVEPEQPAVYYVPGQPHPYDDDLYWTQITKEVAEEILEEYGTRSLEEGAGPFEEFMRWLLTDDPRRLCFAARLFAVRPDPVREVDLAILLPRGVGFDRESLAVWVDGRRVRAWPAVSSMVAEETGSAPIAVDDPVGRRFTPGSVLVIGATFIGTPQRRQRRKQVALLVTYRRPDDQGNLPGQKEIDPTKCWDGDMVPAELATRVGFER